MKFISVVLSLFVLILVSSNVFGQRRSIIGDLRVQKLESKVFGNTRMLRVLVPPGYNRDKSKHYKVLYLNDGQNLFEITSSQSAFTEWAVDETLDDLYDRREIEPIIVVGIDNSGEGDRTNEYLPWADEVLSPPIDAPVGKKYPAFLLQEVIPFIEGNYRVKTGAQNRGIGGASYGALISLYTVLQDPGKFGEVLLESPSLYVSENSILKLTRETKKFPSKIYIGVGTNEDGKEQCVSGDRTQKAVQDVLNLREILREKKVPDANVKLVIEDCATHTEVAFGRRFVEAMRFFYSTSKSK